MKITTALAGAALAALPLAGTATATTSSPTEAAHVRLTVTRTTTDGLSTTGTIWLDCPGREGTGHPHRASACTDVDAADGDFDQLPGRDHALCSNDTVAVTATAQGTAEGRTVHWQQTYESDCHLTLATGDVFAF
ncbi:SSI family serine proteinase inhibitor [Streptomyces sp. NPDC056503]|uniref:SSI family serine proteinase inhibitor n=1 Tax=Streptomyces sp. NPDC056503 TaxID=3345842 RepID=UPI0036933AF8